MKLKAFFFFEWKKAQLIFSIKIKMQISKIYIDNSILLCYNVFEVKGKDKALSKNSYKGEKIWKT